MLGLLGREVRCAVRRGFAALPLTLPQWHVHGVFRLMAEILQLAPVFHPFDGLRLILKVAKSDSLLAREQGDVIVRHAQLDGITEECDPVRGIRRELLEGLEDPVSLDREQGLRRAHVHEDAWATVLDAFENHCTKKPSCFFGGFPFEQVCPEITAFHRDLVLHNLSERPCGVPLFSIYPSPGRQASTCQRKRQAYDSSIIPGRWPLPAPRRTRFVGNP